jgi:tRNA nucleotidyltransferase (CCA-adding enzyme)
MPQIKNLVDKLATRLPPEELLLFEAVRSQAESAGLSAYLVGGTVRDLLLDRHSLDVDIVIEGDAVRLAREVAARTGARLAKTTAFGTATLKANSFSLDLATARSETYSRPGALPKVTPSTIDADLLRRDFTINAIALQLTAPAANKLLDPTGGAADLRAGHVRVLHDRSFQDDATRILRAVRYEARFRFRLEERTLDLLKRDLPYLDRISGTRIRQELARTFAEPDPERALARLQDLGVLAAIHPALTFTRGQAAAVPRLREMHAQPLSLWPLLFWNVPSNRLPDAVRRLALTRAQSAAVEAVPHARDLQPRLERAARPSQIARLIDPLPLPTACALAAISPSPGITAYLTAGRTTRPILRGDDVIALGVLRGPDVADVLALLRAAKLDGEVKTRADEQDLVEEFLARERIGLA